MLLASLLLAAFARSLSSPVPATIPASPIPSPVCVVAAAVTASECDPTRTRTILDILYSCIGVILLCTYISMHHNIPDQDDSWAKVMWSKFRTMLYALMAPEMVIMWAIRQWIMARKIARDNKRRGWTRTHGFFVQMGGLVRRENVRGKLTYRVVCDPSDLKGIKIPSIPEKEIKDHGKGDLLAKALVVVQTTWFVAQCIARRVESLVLTEIELVTLAFATLNVFTYGVWWDKPLNVGYPIYFDEDGVRIDGPLAMVSDPEEAEGRVKEWKGAWYSRIWSSVEDYVAGWGKGCQNVWRDAKESWEDCVDRWGGMMAVVALPFVAIFGPLLDMMTDANVENKTTSVHPFYTAPADDEDRYFAVVFGSVIGIIFGGIHLIGWNFQFLTIIELWLWRASSLVLTVVPSFLAIAAVIDMRYDDNLVLVLTGIVGPPLYFTARIILLFLAFFTLRDLPDPAYQNVKWTEFIPHI
ncbi:hypothetical protein AX16_010068 [Volvariella volvacea WC 439]|nr:hypothetical protein AX16_010068 [Volvariella volvacea WC 439]